MKMSPDGIILLAGGLVIFFVVGIVLIAWRMGRPGKESYRDAASRHKKNGKR